MGHGDFSGRVAIVTGAWRGLGRAAAERLHERGASVAVNVRDRERAEAMAKKIGERAFAVPGDVTADGVPDEIARRTLERFGRIDILVNNAGMSPPMPSHEVTEELFDSVLNLNFKGPFRLASQVARRMSDDPPGGQLSIEEDWRPIPQAPK